MSPDTMFAWQFTPSGRELEQSLSFNAQAPLPVAKKGPRVLIKVFRASINPADFKLLEMPLYPRFIGTPITPGTAFVGRVAESETGAWKAGDLVLGCLQIYPKHGTLAEYVAAGPGDVLVKLDRDLLPRIDDFAGIDAAAMTALYSLQGLRSGDKVFINGASGGTGTFGVQLAKAVGLFVVASCSARNVDLVKGLGAQVVVDYTGSDVIKELQENVKQSGKPFDRIIQNVPAGAGKLYYQSHTILDQDGAFYFIGMDTSVGNMLETFKMALWPGFLGGGKRKLEMPSTPLKQELLEEPLKMAVARKIKTVLDQVYELEDVPKAFAKLRSGRATGKITVMVSSEDDARRAG